MGATENIQSVVLEGFSLAFSNGSILVCAVCVQSDISQVTVEFDPDYTGTAHRATIHRMPSGKWRAQIRRVGHRPLSHACASKTAAERWARDCETKLDQGLQIGAA